MLSELLISRSGTRQAAVLLHLTKPHTPERTDNKTFQSSGKTATLTIARWCFLRWIRYARESMRWLIPPPGVSLPSPGPSPCMHALHLRSVEQLSFFFFLRADLGFLCKFQSPTGTQSPNQFTAQVLILSAHKLLVQFLISHEHIDAQISFVSCFPLISP